MKSYSLLGIHIITTTCPYGPSILRKPTCAKIPLLLIILLLQLIAFEPCSRQEHVTCNLLMDAWSFMVFSYEAELKL